MKKIPYDGPVMVSTGQRVTEWTARQGRSRQGWGHPAEDTKLVNAKASTSGSFKFSGKGVKLASARREAVLA